MLEEIKDGARRTTVRFAKAGVYHKFNVDDVCFQLDEDRCLTEEEVFRCEGGFFRSNPGWTSLGWRESTPAELEAAAPRLLHRARWSADFALEGQVTVALRASGYDFSEPTKPAVHVEVAAPALAGLLPSQSELSQPRDLRPWYKRWFCRRLPKAQVVQRK